MVSQLLTEVFHSVLKHAAIIRQEWKCWRIQDVEQILICHDVVFPDLERIILRVVILISTCRRL